MSRPAKITYKTTNWRAYHQALRQRDSLTVWFDPSMQWEAIPSGRRGRQQAYSDAAIQACLTIKVLFGYRYARPWKPDTAGVRAHNAILRTSKHLGRILWRRWRGYHCRSRVETKMNCVVLLGQQLMSRDFDRQVAEVLDSARRL